VGDIRAFIHTSRRALKVYQYTPPVRPDRLLMGTVYGTDTA